MTVRIFDSSFFLYTLTKISKDRIKSPQYNKAQSADESRLLKINRHPKDMSHILKCFYATQLITAVKYIRVSVWNFFSFFHSLTSADTMKFFICFIHIHIINTHIQKNIPKTDGIKECELNFEDSLPSSMALEVAKEIVSNITCL